MRYIETNELKNINGGGIKIGFLVAIGTAITFIIGFIDGLVRPLKCNK